MKYLMMLFVLLTPVISNACYKCGNYLHCIYKDNQYSQPNTSLRYNPYENEWGYSKSTDKIRYNPYENDWSYQSKDDSLKYNPYNNKWEWAN